LFNCELQIANYDQRTKTYNKRPSKS
jgi:hypothetical protein